MGADKPANSIPFVQDDTYQARARWGIGRARRVAANLDREPLPPDAPDVSPVEARFRRFG